MSRAANDGPDSSAFADELREQQSQHRSPVGDIAEADTLQKRAPPPRGLTRAGDWSVLSVDRCADLPQGVLGDGAGRGAAVEEDSSEMAAVAHQLGAVFANRT